MSDESPPVTAAELDALRVELREALLSVMDEILNSVHSVAPPVRSQVQLAETRLAERLDEIERKQDSSRDRGSDAESQRRSSEETARRAHLDVSITPGKQGTVDVAHATRRRLRRP